MCSGRAMPMKACRAQSISHLNCLFMAKKEKFCLLNCGTYQFADESVVELRLRGSQGHAAVMSAPEVAAKLVKVRAQLVPEAQLQVMFLRDKTPD